MSFFGFQVYFTTVTVIIFIIPAIIIILCYAIIIYIIWQNGKKQWSVKPAVKKTWYNRRKGESLWNKRWISLKIIDSNFKTVIF